MKLVAFLMMFLFLQYCTSQKPGTISFAGKDLSLQDIFKVIKTQAGVSFFYDARLLEDAKRVTINWKNTRVQKALNEIFRDQPVNWVLENNTVTIIKRNVAGITRQDR